MNSKRWSPSLAYAQWAMMVAAVALSFGVLSGCSGKEDAASDPAAPAAEEASASEPQQGSEQASQASPEDEVPPEEATTEEIPDGADGAAPAQGTLVAVPNVSGIPLEDAAEKLQSANLEWNARFEPRAGVPEGQVVDQNPRADFLATEGAVIELVVAAVPPPTAPTPATVRMPAVLGLTAATATAKLRAVKLSYKVTNTAISGVPPGQVVGQSPNDGDLVEEKTVVRLLVATAPPRRVGFPALLQRVVPTAAPTKYRVVAAHSSKCLDVKAFSKSNGAQVYQWQCHGKPNQQWTFSAGQLKSVNSGLCLDVKGQSKTKGALVHQWSCHSGASQRWTFSGGRLMNVNSKMCLDVSGSSKNNGATVFQWPCHGKTNQRWSFKS